MNEHDQLVTDITKMLIHIRRTDILRFIRKFVWNVMEREGLNPGAIVPKAD